MTIAFTPPDQALPVSPGIVVDAIRCWRESRAEPNAVQPALFALLARHEQGMLAPVLDSLFLLYEAALGHSLRAGEDAMLSEDEYLLLALLGGAKARRDCMDCAAGVGTALDCALCSTRIMLALTDRGHRRASVANRA